MRVEVKFQTQTRPMLGRWSDEMESLYFDGERQAAFLVEELVRVLIETEGKPEGSIEEPGMRPSTRWWEFTTGWWLRYAIRLDRPNWLIRLWRPSILKITVLTVSNRDPLRSS